MRVFESLEFFFLHCESFEGVGRDVESFESLSAGRGLESVERSERLRGFWEQRFLSASRDFESFEGVESRVLRVLSAVTAT